MNGCLGDLVREVEEFEVHARDPGYDCLDLIIDCWQKQVTVERHRYWREFRSINDFILRNWGACVDTVFSHVSGQIVEPGSAGEKVMTIDSGNCDGL